VSAPQWRGLRPNLQWPGDPRRHGRHGSPCRLPIFLGRQPRRGLRDSSRAHRGGGARRRGPHQPGGGEKGVPGASGRPGTLVGAAPLLGPPPMQPPRTPSTRPR
jgi:hypothetical protein